MLGSFNNGQPRIPIEATGTNPKKTPLDAIIDTGFNGDLQLPYLVAFPMGLVLDGTQTSTIADGNSAPHLVCSGEVCVDGVCVPSSIDVRQSGEILIGTSLLKKLKKAFFIDALIGKVEIKDSEEKPPEGPFAVVKI